MSDDEDVPERPDKPAREPVRWDALELQRADKARGPEEHFWSTDERTEASVYAKIAAERRSAGEDPPSSETAVRLEHPQKETER